ncbi:MAG: amidohydrolase family protein [Candidatus Heimdallarchaeaceae archaeon]
MQTLYAPKALIGENLELKNHVLITISEDGTIQSLDTEVDDYSADTVLSKDTLVLPSFINMHTHIGDFLLKDQGFGLSLREVVGRNGVKHSFLNKLSDEKLQLSLEHALSLLISNGYSTFVDFREGGIKGASMLRKVLESFLIRGIVLGRPSADDNIDGLVEYVDGYGFSDAFSVYEKKELIENLEKVLSSNSELLLSIHVAETKELVEKSIAEIGKTDLNYVIENLSPSFIVHCNYVTEDNQFLKIKECGIGVVCCPLTASYFGLQFPPIVKCLEYNIPLALGTDNIMIADVNPFFLMRFTLLTLSSKGVFLSPQTILKTLTVNPGLMLNQKIGQIFPGYKADFIGVNLSSPNLIHSNDVYKTLVFRTSVKDINFQMFEGRRIK